MSKNRQVPTDVDTKRRSTLSIRLFLKEFCVEFLHGAYNNLMFVVKVSLKLIRLLDGEQHIIGLFIVHLQCELEFGA